MGAWDVGAFDNDQACDWASLLLRADGAEVLTAAFSEVIAVGSGHLETPEGCNAVAAAEVVARWSGHWGARTAYTQDVDRWAEGRGGHAPASIVDAALAAVDRVMTAPSELLALWDEAEDGPRWRQAMAELRLRLVAARQAPNAT